jgi:hypothetical protein
VEESRETVIWVDEHGQRCEPDRAVRGEVLEELPDGTARSTLFTLKG